MLQCVCYNPAEEMYVYSTSQKHVSIQLLGKHKIQEKLQHINELLSASLSYLGVSSTEPSDEINAVVPSKLVTPCSLMLKFDSCFLNGSSEPLVHNLYT